MPLLIDGHNLIGQMSDIRLSDPDDEAKLVARLQSYYRLTREPITVVFDSGGVQGIGRPAAGQGVSVIYAATSEDADSVIRRRVERDRAPRQLTVVSSDRRVTDLALACGAQVVKSRDFARQMDERLNPAGKSAVEEDKPKTTGADVDYWLGIFKEPEPKPKAPKRPKGKRH
ncbi:MAG: NYN domain-containing protein [Anaerolineae bacterium]|nr:NYN domain-containing protein [Anaerolineae bacterium]